MKNKRGEKHKLKKEITSISTQSKSTLSLFLYSALIHEIHHVIKSTCKAITCCHEKKIQKFWTAPKKENKISKPVLLKSTVHNLSLHNLTKKEYEAV